MIKSSSGPSHLCAIGYSRRPLPRTRRSARAMRGLPGAAGGGNGGACGSHRRAVAGSPAREDTCLYTIRVRFEPDPPKADANLRAHGIGFAEAVTVLEDAFALTREDPDAVGEQRFLANKRQRGLSEKGRG
jgi:hypothetical protein